jgi:hypothetical protein
MNFECSGVIRLSSFTTFKAHVQNPSIVLHLPSYRETRSNEEISSYGIWLSGRTGVEDRALVVACNSVAEFLNFREQFVHYSYGYLRLSEQCCEKLNDDMFKTTQQPIDRYLLGRFRLYLNS